MLFKKKGRNRSQAETITRSSPRSGTLVKKPVSTFGTLLGGKKGGREAAEKKI